MSKNIVVCCDGTDNQFSGCQTNVVRLFKCAKNIPGEQVAYYDPGVGTMAAPGLYGKIAKRASVLLGLAFGFGFSQNVEDAYEFLMQTYEPGDQVYLFGFSRGAFTVRALAGMLHAVGLLRPNTENLIPYARRYWRDSYSDTGREVAADFKRTLARECKPHFVGVWDTVSSVGWISNFKTFPYTRHNPDIAIFRHAVSIDERRCFFRQNLFEADLPTQDVKNVWFAGVHSDVGGGYPYDEIGLSQIAFEWMANEALQAKLQLDEDLLAVELGREVKPDVPRCSPPNPAGPLHESLSGFWWVCEFLPRKRWDAESRQYHWILRPAMPRTILDGADVHASVPDRMKLVADYRPVNLPQNYKVVGQSGNPPAFSDKSTGNEVASV